MTVAPPPAAPEEPPRRTLLWRYAPALAMLLVLWLLVVAALYEPVTNWLRGEDTYDQAAVQEWLEEARGFQETLPEMIDTYLKAHHRVVALHDRSEYDAERVGAQQHEILKGGVIASHLEGLGNPSTKMYAGQLILFPTIYRIQVDFDTGTDGAIDPITWDSALPVHASQYRELRLRLHPGATVDLRYQLHAYNRRQQSEQERRQRVWQLAFLAVAVTVTATVLVVVWVVIVQGRERERERQRQLARQQVAEAERLLLQEENRHAETERQLLEQRLATQNAEQKALELKSQLYAGISIMAGSYAHNIKNLLVRPCCAAASTPTACRATRRRCCTRSRTRWAP